MKQIYNFEQGNPPILNEKMLQRECEKRKLQRQIVLLAVSSMLLILCMVLMAFRIYIFMPVLSVICALYVCAAVTGSCVIILVFVQKRRSYIKC